MSVDLYTLALRVKSTGTAGAVKDLRTIESAGEHAAKSVANAAAMIKRSVAGIAAAVGVRELKEYADTWTLMSGRLRVVSKSFAEAAVRQKELFELSQYTRSGIDQSVTLYGRLARSLKELNVPQKDVLTATKAINQAFQISGATSQEAANATIQLSQALGSGELRGDELRSVLEQAPILARAIAKDMGIAFTQVRKYAEQGLITSESVFRAVLNSSADLDAQFKLLPKTIDQAFTQLKNSAIKFVGELSTASGASKTLADTISLIASNFSELAGAAIALGGVALARKIGQWTQGLGLLMKTQVTSISVSRAASAAEIEEAHAIAQSTKAEVTKRFATIASLNADKEAIVWARQRALAELQKAQAIQKQAAAVPIAQLTPLGGRAVEREIARRAAADRAASTAMKELATLGQQQSRINKVLIAENAALTASQRTATAAAAAVHAAALSKTTLAARATAGVMKLLRGAMNFLGGPVGVILAAVAGAWWLISRRTAKAREELEKYTDEYRKSITHFDSASLIRLATAKEQEAELLKTQREALKVLDTSKPGYAEDRRGVIIDPNAAKRDSLLQKEKQLRAEANVAWEQANQLTEGNLRIGTEAGIKTSDALETQIDWLKHSVELNLDREGSLARLRTIESHLATTVRDGTIAIEDRIKAAKQLAEVTNTLIANAASQDQINALQMLKGRTGPQMTNISAQVTDDSVRQGYEDEAAALLKEANRRESMAKSFGIVLNKQKQEEIKALRSRAADLQAVAAGGMAKLSDAMIPKVDGERSASFVDRLMAPLEGMAQQIENMINQTLGDSIYNAFAALFDGKGIKGLISQFGQTIAAGVGEMFTAVGMKVMAGFGKLLVDQGKIALQNAALVQKFLAALKSMNPFAMAAAGVGLIALGSALGSIGGGAGRGTASAGSFREPRYGTTAEDITRIKIVSDSEASRTRVEQAQSVSFNVFGPNDPQAQRAISQALDNYRRRG